METDGPRCMPRSSPAWTDRRLYRYNRLNRRNYTVRCLLLSTNRLPSHSHTPYIVSYSIILGFTSTWRPMVLRISIRVVICGLPSPRSMATSVFTATPESSATVRWFTPSDARRDLIACPISFRSIVSTCCDFRCKNTIFFDNGKIKLQCIAIFCLFFLCLLMEYYHLLVLYTRFNAIVVVIFNFHIVSRMHSDKCKDHSLFYSLMP